MGTGTVLEIADLLITMTCGTVSQVGAVNMATTDTQSLITTVEIIGAE
jgi:hypothetical protein